MLNNLKKKYREDHPEIFNEIKEEYEKIGNKLETNSINFIKFLLEKHPPKDYNNQIDVEKEFKENPIKLMKIVGKLYSSDHLDTETIEQRKNYVIIREIEVLISSFMI